jgi:hypothetical protein
MKYRYMVIALAIVSLALILGCATLPKTASGPAFKSVQLPAGKAVVYFFRSDKFMMSANSIFMSIPKAANNCFGMVTAGYYAYVTDPGELTVTHAARDGEKEYTIDIEAGDVKYVKVDFNDDMMPKTFYQEIPAAQALPEISKYRLIEPCK